ncbi:FixH family protein [uncultured Alsobacter sp.]|uniref:FixH family protein n=1 Tax=uncultured Alsobacter sp. TaxID=1748258 RepID=UPI0025CB93D2|nr:FixH family protein [uncultured Alsobacter sp.]
MTQRLSLAGARLREPETPAGRNGFRLTGKHVIVMFALFFAVVLAVNVVMMRIAITTFSGVESETPYKNGLAYNTRLDAARQQAALGWSVDARVQRTDDGHVSVSVEARDKAGRAITDLTGVVRFERPTDKRLDRETAIAPGGAGRYTAELDGIGVGVWEVVVLFGEGGPTEFESRNRIELH